MIQIFKKTFLGRKCRAFSNSLQEQGDLGPDGWYREYRRTAGSRFNLAAVPGFARSSTGINSFHVMWPGSAYSCLKEDYAAVVNDCTYTATLTFDMPIDNTGWHGIDVV